MINKDFFAALDEFEKEKKIPKAVFIEALESGLVSAFKRETGEARPIMVKLNEDRCEIKVYACKTIVEEVQDHDKEILLADAKEIKKSYKLGDVVMWDVTPKQLSRIAIQTAKQVIMQRLQEEMRTRLVSEMTEKEGEVVVARIVKVESDAVLLELGSAQIQAIMSGNDIVESEKYFPGRKLKVYIKKTRTTSRGVQVQVSRSDVGLVRKLFEQEVPEIKSGDVVIEKVVRDAGSRTKVCVSTRLQNVDPIGSCIGHKGVRINEIVKELNGEKVDVIQWSEDPFEIIKSSLSPAEVLSIREIDEKVARVVVPDSVLSLAIGKGGQNARLTAKMTGWKIDVKPESKELAELAEQTELSELSELTEL